MFSERIQTKIDKYLNPSAIKRFGIATLVISFAVANFLAWEDEHQRVGDEHQKVVAEHKQAEIVTDQLKKEKENNKPVFILGLNQCISGDISALDAGIVFLNIILKNLGAPSIAHGWKLNIKSPSINIDSIVPTLISDGLKLFDENNKLLARFTAGNRMEERAMKPIAKNDMASGWLWFIFPRIHQKQLKGATVTLFVQDILDHEYCYSFILNQPPNKGELFYYPGSGPNPFLGKKRVKKY